MKVAIFSDIHSNLDALDAVLGHASNELIDEYVCLGDVVGYGAQPAECLRRVRELPNVTCIKGNHDAAVVDERERESFHEVALEGIRYTLAHLDEEALQFLRTLPFEYSENNNFLAVHASPFHPDEWEYILDHESAERAFGAMESHRVAFVGHSHSPVVFCDDGSAERFVPGAEAVLDVSQQRYVINVGSVGQPRDGNPDASYCIYDLATTMARNFRVHYDRERAAEKILRAGLPPMLAERLLVGY